MKQAEISSWRREVRVGGGGEAGVVVLVLAINIFVGLREDRAAKLRIWELGTELALRRSKTAALWGTL